MEKHISGLVIALSVLFLLVGGLVGFAMGSEKVVTEIQTEIVYQNVSVDKIVEIPTVSVLEKAVSAFMEAVEDEELLLLDEAGNDVDVLEYYNFDEVEVLKVYDAYTVSYDDEMTTVNFEIRLKFDDGDERLKESYDVEVIFEDDEDTKVTAVIA